MRAGPLVARGPSEADGLASHGAKLGLPMLGQQGRQACWGFDWPFVGEVWALDRFVQFGLMVNGK